MSEKFRTCFSCFKGWLVLTIPGWEVCKLCAKVKIWERYVPLFQSYYCIPWWGMSSSLHYVHCYLLLVNNLTNRSSHCFSCPKFPYCTSKFTFQCTSNTKILQMHTQIFHFALKLFNAYDKYSNLVISSSISTIKFKVIANFQFFVVGLW